MGILGDFFGGGDPEKAAQAGEAQERAAIAQALGLLKPFQGAGEFAIPRLEDLFSQDPTSIVNRIGAQYQQSPFEQFQASQAQKGLESQLAGAGLAGSGEAIQRSGQLARQMAGQGQEQFLQDVLGQRGQQISGLQGLFGGGLSAAQTGAGLLGQEGQALAGLESAGQLGSQGRRSKIMGGIGSALGSLFGGGSGGGMFGGGGSGGLMGLFRNKQFIDPDTGVPFDPQSLLPGIV